MVYRRRIGIETPGLRQRNEIGHPCTQKSPKLGVAWFQQRLVGLVHGQTGHGHHLPGRTDSWTRETSTALGLELQGPNATTVRASAKASPNGQCLRLARFSAEADGCENHVLENVRLRLRNGFATVWAYGSKNELKCFWHIVS